MNKDVLNKILDNHKLWLKTDEGQGEKADLRWADLRWADLRWADLRGADLRWADLRGADLSEADLRWADLSEADLRWADLRWADLRWADLRWADLSEADLDYSSMPLSCNGLDVHIDDRIAIQQLYHLVRNVQFSKNTSAEMKKLCMLKSIVKKANEFHRVEECGEIRR